VLRGRALRDTFVLRFLAIEHCARGLLLLTLAYGVWRFDGSRAALKQIVNSYLPAIEPLANKIGVDLGIDLKTSGPARLLEGAFTAKHSTLRLIALGVLAYGALELVEGFGLWFKRRWGEYVAVVATTLFVPLEIHEIIARVTVLLIGALIINLFAIVYLLWAKRLFGFRGGHVAFETERRNDSLIEVELSSAAAGDPHPATKAPTDLVELSAPDWLR